MYVKWWIDIYSRSSFYSFVNLKGNLINGIIEYEDILDNFKVINFVIFEILIKWIDWIWEV